MAYVYPGTVGLPIRLVLLDSGTVHDPASATVRQMTFIQPDGTSRVKDATVSVTHAEIARPGYTIPAGATCLEYVTVAGDLDMPGAYRVVGYIEDGAGKWPTEPGSFRVREPLRAVA